MKPSYAEGYGRAGGFTLIELLITVTIVLLLSGASVAAFLDYRDRSSTNSDANSVAERLRTVQIKASATEIPTGCTTVTNYVVSYSAGSSDLTVTATCAEGSTNISSLGLTLVSAVFVTGGSVIFDSRTVSSSGATISVCGYNKLFTITVSPSGNVGKPVFVPAGC